MVKGERREPGNSITPFDFIVYVGTLQARLTLPSFEPNQTDGHERRNGLTPLGVFLQLHSEDPRTQWIVIEMDVQRSEIATLRHGTPGLALANEPDLPFTPP